MKWLLGALLALGLAGCANWGIFNRQESAEPTPTGHALSPTKSSPRKSLAAAETSRAHAGESPNNSPLMECVSNSCRTQCSAEVEKQSRPKWCMYFKEPIDTHAVSATSDSRRKSAE